MCIHLSLYLQSEASLEYKIKQSGFWIHKMHSGGRGPSVLSNLPWPRGLHMIRDIHHWSVEVQSGSFLCRDASAFDGPYQHGQWTELAVISVLVGNTWIKQAGTECAFMSDLYTSNYSIKTEVLTLKQLIQTLWHQGNFMCREPPGP